MGNMEGLSSAIVNRGTNEIVEVNKKVYFSFALGTEIAFCIKGKYFILNCHRELFDKVKNKLQKTKKISKIKKWWIKKSKEYEICDWSDDFSLLK